jgi:hypothetical protein
LRLGLLTSMIRRHDPTGDILVSEQLRQPGHLLAAAARLATRRRAVADA